MRIFIGHDSREPEASRVALASLKHHCGDAFSVEILDIVKLRAQGLYTRPTETRDGRLWDAISDAPMSTEFAISRFLVPIIARGLALFVDGDVVFQENPAAMLGELGGRAMAAAGAALAVVKHSYAPAGDTKMDGQLQTRYQCKNWSSVMLFDCDHPANHRLTLQAVNTHRGLDLHQFEWLEDDEIAALHPRWNWLVGEQQPPAGRGSGIAHFTLGGPFTPGWQGGPHDEIWNEAARWTR